MANESLLASWNDTPTRMSIVEFVDSVTREGSPTLIPVEERIAVFDDGPVKPTRIWSRIGRRRVIAGGNSNGDIPMLRFARVDTRPALRLLVIHDDAKREFDDQKGAENVIARASDKGWTSVSIANDWSRVFVN